MTTRQTRAQSASRRDVIDTARDFGLVVDRRVLDCGLVTLFFFSKKPKRHAAIQIDRQGHLIRILRDDDEDIAAADAVECRAHVFIDIRKFIGRQR